MQPLTRSITCHVVMPYIVHLAVAVLVIHNFSIGDRAAILIFGGWVTLLGLALIGIPFGVMHVLQAVSFARSEFAPGKQFLVGLLNPSFASITIVAIIFFAPALIL